MAQREPVPRIEALYREWPGSANSGLMHCSIENLRSIVDTTPEAPCDQRPSCRKWSALSRALPFYASAERVSHHLRLLALVLLYQFVNLTFDRFKVERGRSLHRGILDCSLP